MRNKTTIITIILDAAIILAVSLFMFVIRPWDKADKVETDYTPAPELTIAEQEGIEPVEPIVGNSKPVDVEPVDGIRITAPANALDKDREFKITAVSDNDWDALEKKLSDVSEDQMLFCFDLDAGMAPDEHLPGEFTLSLDLAKMGIPPILQDKISVWRQAGDQMYQYTSWLQNGKLTFSSDQNCFLIFALPSGMALLKTVVGALVILGGATYAYETWEKHATTGDLYKNFFTMNKDAVKFEIKDSYGDFTVYFRFKDTEYADRFDTYKENCENFVRRGKDLEEKAETEYGRQVEEKYNEERAEWTTWQKIMGSAEAKRKARAAIDKAAILAKLCEEDALLKRYAEGMQLPPSIRDLESMFKQANCYLTEDQGLRPQTRNLEVDLINSGPSGEYRHTATKHPYMVINYPKMLSGGSTYTRKGHGESMLLTITHELFHHRQKTHKWPPRMDYRSEESTAAYLEACSADYYLAKGYMTTNFNHPAKGTETKFVKDNFDPASRDNYEVFGNNFNSRIGDPDLAYTYADLMDYIQEHKKMKPLKGGFIMNQYAYTSSYKTNYMKWFGITDEKELEKWIRLFCVDSLGRIYDQQGTSLVKSKHPSLALDSYQFSRSNPIREVRTKGYGLSMRTFDVECSNFKQEGSFNAFIVPGEQCKPDEVWFYTSSDGFKKDKSESTYFQSDNPTWRYSGAYFQGPSSLLFGPSFKIVALFAPDAPKIEKVKRDYVSFKLPKPESVLVKNKYITRALVTCTLKDGSERRILASADKFGKKVKWTIDGIGEKDFSLTVRWISEGENRPVYESPDSKPAVHGAIPPTPEASANVGGGTEEKTVTKNEPATKGRQETEPTIDFTEYDKQEKMVVMESELPDISVDYLCIVIKLPDSPVEGHSFDVTQPTQKYRNLTVTKEGNQYRIVGEMRENIECGREWIMKKEYSSYPGGSYEDRLEVTMDEEYMIKEGTFTWAWTYHDLDTSFKPHQWYKQQSDLSVRFTKDLNNKLIQTGQYSEGYQMTSLSASWKGPWGKHQRNFSLSSDDLQYGNKGDCNVELHYRITEK